MKNFQVFTQHDQMDCGPTCLRMIARWYGKNFSLEHLKNKCNITRNGVSLAGISEASESIGFRTLNVQLTFDKLEEEAPLPCIAHWDQRHFVVIYKISKGKVWVADPVGQKVVWKREEFMRLWASSNSNGLPVGIVLLLEPTPSFYSIDPEDSPSYKKGIVHLLTYLQQHRAFIWQLIIGLMVGSLIQLTLPFLTQGIVDVGINTRNINFIYIILLAQLMLSLSRTVVDLIRGWILLHLSTRINMAMVSDFLIKIMLVPLSFFSTRSVGDVLQRISDHTRIQFFLSTSSLNILFSFFNLIVFGIILLLYSLKIFLIFFGGSALYFFFVIQFLKRREELDYKMFSQQSANQSALIQLIAGISEIKLNGAEKEKRWDWERVQAKLFKVSVASMKLLQFQQSGSFFINEIKNIIITILAAQAVINGEMTLGMMLAVQYIIGQLNGPVNEATQFIRSWQDARISLERIGEVYDHENEEREGPDYQLVLPQERTIRIQNISFHYEGEKDDPVLKDISFEMPGGKVTALVGVSGSGKTTLMKLLLKFYKPSKGTIEIGGTDLQSIHSMLWRKMCGTVMQDGYIFSETIARNIALGDETIDQQRLWNSVKLANIVDHIESLPLAFNTKIGSEGMGLSQGQKQRILIARAIYRNPNFLFFDEATSSLDANNEKQILENLEEVFKGRTVLVIAHRLSTVKNADQILVMDKGRIVERGTHASLVALRGHYYHLVKNQLELGN